MKQHMAGALIAGLGLFVANVAHSHIIITSHETRLDRGQIKRGPCGSGNSARGDIVHTFTAGETITIEFDEFIFHPGYFRVAFDDDGDDSFVDPVDYFDFDTNETVLMDNILPDHARADGPIYTLDIELPDVECDNCTLQFVQMMTDKPPYVVGTNDLYYNCLDVILVADPDAEPDPTPDPQPNPEPTPMPDPQPSPMPDAQPDAQPEPTPAPQPDAQPDAQPEPTPAPSNQDDDSCSISGFGAGEGSAPLFLLAILGLLLSRKRR